MKVVVIGSVNACSDEFKDIKKFFENRKCEVITPIDDDRQNGTPLIMLMEQYIEYIKNADIVIACSKNHLYCEDETSLWEYERLEFGESTSYEIAIAKCFHKPILYWRGGISIG